MNTNTIANGVAATVTATLAGSNSAAIGVINALGASAAGSALTLIATGGTVNAAASTLTASSLTCSPSNLAPGASSTCTVTVSGTSGATVGLSSNSAMLTVPASVTVPAGSNAATFLATAGQFTTNQNPTVTASLGGVSQTAMLSLVSSAAISSLQCAVATLAANSNTTCTVTLNKPASAGGSSVTLTSNNTWLVIPNSVLVPANASSATFTAAAGNLITSQSVVVTGTLSGSSASYNMILAATAATLVSLNCTPSTLPAGGSSACTVTLSKPPTAGFSISLASNNANLTVPATVSVATGSASAVFTAVAGNSFTNDQTATVTATLNGAATTALLNLTAPVVPPVVSSLTCIPASLASNTSTNCTVTLNKAATAGGAVVTISNTNSVLSAASSITVSAGATTAVFIATAGTVASDQTATLTASLGSSSASAVIGLATAPLVSSLSCSPNSLGANASTNCTVTLTKPAATGGAAVAISSNNGLLTAPTSITVAGGATTGVFIATAGSVSSDQAATLTVTLGSSSVNTVIGLAAAPLVSSLSCGPNTLGSNASTSCTVTLTKPAATAGAVVTISSNNSALTAPTSITVTGGATTAVFTATTGTLTSDQSATLTATLGASSVSATVGLGAATLISSLSCTPTSLGSNASTNCTVTLTKAAPTAGAVVTISSNNSALTAPTSITVTGGATTAAFTASTGTLTSDQSATLTATLGASSVNAVVGLGAAALISSLSCTPTSLGSNASGTCTVTLTKAAPSAGISVSLTSNTAALTLPSSVTVPAAASSANFRITTAALSSDQIATLTAQYGANSVNTDVSLLAPALLSSITCNPNALRPNSSSTCTVTLTKGAAAGGASVAVSTVNSLLSAPSLLTIAAGSTSGSFALQAGSFTTAQSGSVTVAYNGSSTSATVQLQAGVFVSSVACSPKALLSGGTSTCTATLSQPVAADTSLTLGSSSALLTLPASIVVPAGNATQNFTVTAGAINANTTAVVSATLGTSSQSTSITLSATPTLSSLACNPTKLTVGASAVCTVTLSQPTSGVFVTLASNSPALVVPSGVAVPQGSTSATFTAVAQSPATGSVSLTASYNGTSQGTLLTILAADTTGGLKRIICHPNTLQRGNRGQCRVTLRETGTLPGSDVQLRSSSGSVLLPAMLRTRAGQSTVTFQVEAASDAAGPVVIEAQLGDDIVRDAISIMPDRSQALRVPGNQYVKYGSELRFQVSSSNPSATLSAGALPAGAYFDSTAAEFRWIPGASQIGVHEIQFTAADSGGILATQTAKIEVETGEPVITGIVNAASRSSNPACSPGAIATVQGRWFTSGSPAADASGGSLQLAGARVLVNGVAAPILAASTGALNFLCPAALPGASLQIEVQTDYAVSTAAMTVSQAAAPGIFALDGGSQGAALLEGGTGRAVIRNYRVTGQPAIAGEHVTVYATGIQDMANIVARFGDSAVLPASITAVPGQPGIFQVTMAIPDGTEDGEMPLSLTGDAPGGMTVTSNIVPVAVEGNAR